MASTNVPVGWIRKIGSKYQLRRAPEQQWTLGEQTYEMSGILDHNLFDYKTNMAEAMQTLQKAFPGQKLRWQEATTPGYPQMWTAYIIRDNVFDPDYDPFE